MITKIIEYDMPAKTNHRIGESSPSISITGLHGYTAAIVGRITQDIQPKKG
ncbi:MAG: hypothetical protein V4481_01475 [Patescibacteria group bacterium]